MVTSRVENSVDPDQMASPEFLIDQNRFFNISLIFITLFPIAVRQEVESIDNSVVVHKLKLTINRDLYGL